MPDEDALVAAAREAREHAHAPYSTFRVGAALESVDGRVFTGCNVENASHGLALCAERVAVAAAITAGARRFRRLALVTDAVPPALPCGACRQVLAEFCSDLPLTLVGGAGREDAFLAELLPRPFTGAARRSHPAPASRDA